MFRNWMTKRIKYVCWRWGRSTSHSEKGEIMSSEIKLNLVACLCIFVAIIFVIMFVLFDKKIGGNVLNTKSYKTETSFFIADKNYRKCIKEIIRIS